MGNMDDIECSMHAQCIQNNDNNNSLYVRRYNKSNNPNANNLIVPQLRVDIGCNKNNNLLLSSANSSNSFTTNNDTLLLSSASSSNSISVENEFDEFADDNNKLLFLL